MSSLGKDKILFIVNPISGVGKQRKIEYAVEKYLDKEKFDYKIAYTSYPHHATAIAIASVIRDFNIVVAVGGDGSINDCVKGLFSTGTILGIIPTGSGNGLARCLNIPLSIKEAIFAINNKRVVDIDTISFNNTVFASIAGIGFDALIAKEFSKVNSRGFQPYLKLVLQHYPNYIPKNYKLEIDGRIVETQALFISFANSTQFGFNTEVAPHAELNDGLLDIVVVKKPPLPLLPWTAQLLFFKNFDMSIYVNTYKARKVKVFNSEILGINIDGEYMEVQEDLEFEVIPSSLKVIIK